MLASSTLKVLAWAQEDFRTNDRDGNGATDYWRKDVAGLHLHVKVSGNSPSFDSMVLADDRARTDLGSRVKSARGPLMQKFWLRAIRLPGEKEPDPGRFALCCFPSAYGPGIRSHYVICQDGVVYRKDLGHGNGIDVYPADPLKEGWAKVD